MKHIILSLIIFIAVISCKTNKKIPQIQEKVITETINQDEIISEKDTCKQKLYAYVKSYWKYDTIRKLYSLGERRGARLLPELFPCLLGMEAAECIKLFGKPSQVSYEGYMYYQSHNCINFEQKTDVTCYYYIFYIKNGKISDAQDGSMSKQN